MAFKIWVIHVERICTCRNVCKKVHFAMACQIHHFRSARRLPLAKARVDVGVTQGIGMHLPWECRKLSRKFLGNIIYTILEIRFYPLGYDDLVFRARTRPTIFGVINFEPHPNYATMLHDLHGPLLEMRNVMLAVAQAHGSPSTSVELDEKNLNLIYNVGGPRL